MEKLIEAAAANSDIGELYWSEYRKMLNYMPGFPPTTLDSVVDGMASSGVLFDGFDDYYDRMSQGNAEAARSYIDLSEKVTETQKAMAAYGVILDNTIRKEGSEYKNAMTFLEDYMGKSSDVIKENKGAVWDAISGELDSYLGSAEELLELLAEFDYID